jgi:hypothetical protein
MEKLATALTAPLAIVWSLAGPITYILSVVDTWNSNISVFWKLLINLTLDAILAAIWPITWLLWVVRYSMLFDGL